MIKPIELLWTGGFDSTYRLLEILFQERLPVRPHYIVDTERKSLANEFNAMNRIRAAVLDDYPELHDRFLPTRLCARWDIDMDEGVVRCLERLRTCYRLGSQYDWLSSYCIQFEYSDIEMAVEKKAHLLKGYAIDQILMPMLRPIRDDSVILSMEGTGHSADSGFPENDLRSVFRFYRFPTITYTKVQMQEAARDRGWTPYLDMTWFCHSPTKRGKACGTCPPCVTAISDGFAYKVPPSNRFRGKIMSSPLYRSVQALYRKIKSSARP